MGALTLACGWADSCCVLLCLPFFSKSFLDICPVPDSGLSPGQWEAGCLWLWLAWSYGCNVLWPLGLVWGGRENIWEGSPGSASQHGIIAAHLPVPSCLQSAWSTECVPGAQAVGTMRSSSHCVWLLGPSINDTVHFWSSVGCLGRANLGWSWVR